MVCGQYEREDIAKGNRHTVTEVVGNEEDHK